MTINDLQKKANYIRDEVIRVAVKNNMGHIAPSLSTVDILTALYYDIMRPFNGDNVLWDDRDRLVLSKGHGCYALYAILNDLRFLYDSDWSKLKGCVERDTESGLEASTGSLGHGLPMAVGMAYGLKLKGSVAKVYCIIGDGEFQEGTTWEAMSFITNNDIDNIKIIVDYNALQALYYSKYNADISYLMFGDDAASCDGHSIPDLLDTLKNYTFINAHTIKGYGLKCMEDVAKFHYRVPTEEELRQGKTYAI